MVLYGMMEPWQIISLSASANKLSKIQEKAEEYARLIMEELDPDNVGYIEVNAHRAASTKKTAVNGDE